MNINSLRMLHFKRANNSSVEEILSLITSNKIFNKYIYEKIISSLENSSVINTLYLYLSEACNLDCKYCFVNKKNNSYMNYDTAEYYLKYFLDNANKESLLDRNNKKVFTIFFYGGEPLLNKDVLIDAVEYINKYYIENNFYYPLKICLNTNGLLISEELIKYFKINNIKIIISLDGFSENHNKLRGLSNQQINLIISNIRNLIINKIDLSISLTINEYNVNDLFEIYKWFLNNFKKLRIGFGNLLQVPLKKNSFNFRFLAYKTLTEIYLYAINSNIDINSYEEEFHLKVNDLERKIIKIKNCSAYGNEMTIDSNGRIFTCHGLISNKNLGFTVFEEFNKERIKWSRRISLLNEDCKICEAKSICGGGCATHNYIEKGNCFEMLSTYCDYQRYIVNFFIKNKTKRFELSNKDFELS